MALRPATIRQGEVYFIENCPPLDDDKDKDRWVVVISPSDELAAGASVVEVVAISASITEQEADRIPLPNRETTTPCTTGLPRACWAVPRWHFNFNRYRLMVKTGAVPPEILHDILVAVLQRKGLL